MPGDKRRQFVQTKMQPADLKDHRQFQCPDRCGGHRGGFCGGPIALDGPGRGQLFFTHAVLAFFLCRLPAGITHIRPQHGQDPFPKPAGQCPALRQAQTRRLRGPALRQKDIPRDQRRRLVCGQMHAPRFQRTGQCPRETAPGLRAHGELFQPLQHIACGIFLRPGQTQEDSLTTGQIQPQGQRTAPGDPGLRYTAKTQFTAQEGFQPLQRRLQQTLQNSQTQFVGQAGKGLLPCGQGAAPGGKIRPQGQCLQR